MTSHSKAARKKAAGEPSVRRRPGPRRALFVLVIALILAVFGELASRCFWSLKHGVHFFRPDLMDVFYPEPDYLAPYTVRNDDEHFDVLLLGGSVVHPSWGFVQECLFEELTYQTKKDVRIYNVADRGHTSRDSYLKYQHRDRHRFDAVVVYHGINETRTNNCPAEVFRPDYTHCSWYAEIELLRSHPESHLLLLPASLDRLWMAASDLLGTRDFIERDAVRPEWQDLGSTIKSAGSFAHNVTGILDIAKSRDEPVILMTFAHHVPADYEVERFYQRELDYVRHGSPVELWGRPGHVVAAIEAHNDAVRRLAHERGAILVDLARQMPQRGDHFNDVCHLSYRGSAAFAQQLTPALVDLARNLR